MVWWGKTASHYFVAQHYIVEGQLEIGMVKEGRKLFLPTKADTNWTQTLGITQT